MTPALYKTPTLLWLITVPIMMVMRMMTSTETWFDWKICILHLFGFPRWSVSWMNWLYPQMTPLVSSWQIRENHCQSLLVTQNHSKSSKFGYSPLGSRANNYICDAWTDYNKWCIKNKMLLPRHSKWMDRKAKRHVLWQLLILPRPVWLHLVSDVWSL